MDKDKCAICGAKLGDDLFSYVTREPVCSICVVRSAIASPVQAERIATIREALGLKPGEYLEQDNAAEERLNE